ncbi:MAG: glycosyltransferase family 4 protein [Pyrinomonadaceae bacterium]|nr:glycosyltransferase family 4 protein [Pyrinomonadaceae bacterium]
MKKIKVLHLTSTRYGIGGVERLLLEMSDKYQVENFDVAYCNLFCDEEGEGKFPTAIRQKGLDYIEISGKRVRDLPSMARNLRKILEYRQIDVLHLHMLQATIVGGLAQMGTRTSTVVTKHYTDGLSRHAAWIKKLDHWSTKRAKCIVAISDYVRQDLIQLGFNSNKITVIHNGTDISEFDRNVALVESSKAAELRDRVLIGSVGSLTERKGHNLLIAAMPRILESVPNAHLMIVGEGPMRAELEQLIDRNGLREQVALVGFRENVAPLLSEMDLYVHPSIHEPFGISILEAMAAKKCVVATSVEGVPEIVLEGITGVLVPPKNCSALSEKIVSLLQNDDQRLRMGEAGRRRVEEHFTIGRVVNEYQAIYKSLAE